MRLVPANKPIGEVYTLLQQGHQVLRINPTSRRSRREGFLWDLDPERLRQTARHYRIANAPMYSSAGGSAWCIKVFGPVLERMKLSAEMSRPMGIAS